MTANRFACKNRGMTHNQIILIYGSPTKAAKRLNVTLQTLRNWKRGGIPIKTQLWIQALTSGALTASKK